MRKLVPALVLVLAACAGGEASAPAEGGASEGATTQSEAAQPSEAAPAESAAAASTAPAADVPGGITITVGDETWEFPGALCATYNAPAGEPGSEWNVSFKDGDIQVYVNVDSFGQDVSLTDVVNYGSLTWVADGDDLTIDVSGNDIHAEGTFRDDANGAPSQPGTLDATCASWYEG